MTSRKKPAPPDVSGLKDDWNQMSRLRRESEGTDQQNAPEPSPLTPVAPQTPKASSPEMSRRSWYAEQEAVEELAEAVEELHFATRAPKHQIVSELFRAAAAAAPKVQKKFSR